MKITILQRNIEWANPQANIARADEAIICLPDADLFVLPEMFSTGFCTQPEGMWPRVQTVKLCTGCSVRQSSVIVLLQAV